MKIYPAKPSNYIKVCNEGIVSYIKDYATVINNAVNPEKTDNNTPVKNLSECDKTQLKAIAAELETVVKRLEWILYGRY